MSHRERILVIYNEPVLPKDHRDSQSEIDVLESAEAVMGVLKAEGHPARAVGVRTPTDLLAAVRDDDPDAVFNLYEGDPNLYATEPYVAGLLDWLDVPFTGCPSAALLLSQNKHFTKRLFQNAGVPTAPFALLDAVPEQQPPGLNWPLIVKPACQDSSVGIDQASVVSDFDALRLRVGYVLENFGGPVLVEEFIAGRELTLGVVEVPHLRPLPVTEVTFQYKKPGAWPILSYDAKWEDSSFEYQETDYLFDVPVEDGLRAKLHHAALTAFRLVGARDYARADFRVRGDEVFLLELNPNPSFAPGRGLTWALSAAGISHHLFTMRMLHNALSRGRRKLRPMATRPLAAS